MKNFAYALLSISLLLACKSETTVESIPEIEAAESEFSSTPDALHYYMVALTGTSDGSILPSLKEQLSEYNKTNFPDSKMRISNIFLGEKKNPIIVVRRFQNEAEALDYHQKFTQDTKSFFQNDWEMKSFPISQINYRTVLKTKTIENYWKYYQSQS